MQSDARTPVENSRQSLSFSGNISEVYENNLGDFLFAPFASDLSQRFSYDHMTHILELACGTGRLTQELLRAMPVSVKLTATDLEADMLLVARRIVNDNRVSWNTVDMTVIPYEAGSFDLVICQFGLMLISDKIKAVQEMNRVLKPGGKLVFSVWGSLAENDAWRIAGEITGEFLGNNLVAGSPGPFSMNDTATIAWLQDAGFGQTKATLVKKIGEIASASAAAKGFINGLPIQFAVKKKDPSLLPLIESTLEVEFIRQLGDHPMRSPLSAWVFEAIK